MSTKILIMAKTKKQVTFEINEINEAHKVLKQYGIQVFPEAVQQYGAWRWKLRVTMEGKRDRVYDAIYDKKTLPKAHTDKIKEIASKMYILNNSTKFF